jgi:hypothetical protein
MGTRHRIDEGEFYRLLKGVVLDDMDGFNTKLPAPYYSARCTSASTAPASQRISRASSARLSLV